MSGRLLALLMIILPVLPVSADTALQISNAWIREAPPGTTVLAGYMTITNPGPEARYILSVSSDDFSSVEIHRTVIENGMARMLSADRLEVPAGGSVALEPGSYHLMLFNPVRPLVTGDTVDVLLHASDDQCIAVSVPVARNKADQQP